MLLLSSYLITLETVLEVILFAEAALDCQTSWRLDISGNMGSINIGGTNKIVQILNLKEVVKVEMINQRASTSY